MKYGRSPHFHISSVLIFLPQAQERQETAFRAPRQRVEDYEELHEYQGRKRKEFEERIRRTRGSMYVSWPFILTFDHIVNIWLPEKNGFNTQIGRSVVQRHLYSLSFFTHLQNPLGEPK